MLCKRGFSLIELIAVILIISVLALMTYTQSEAFNVSLVDSKHSVITAFRHAREQSLYRSERDDDVVLITTTTTIDVRNKGVSVSYPGLNYPLLLPSGIQLSRDLGVSTFDSLGQTNPVVIEISVIEISDIENSDNQLSDIVTVSGAGYAY